MDIELNPFYAFSFIAAPAVLTNASAVLTLSTSNRLARAVDQTRELAAELERMKLLSTVPAQDKLKELNAYQQRMLMLIWALRDFYVSLGCFASTTLLALIGSGSAPHVVAGVTWALEVVAVGIALVAVAAMARGSWLLVRETRIAVAVLSDRANRLQQHFHSRAVAPDELPNPGPLAEPEL
jgi:HAMP domain-containing protein